jgi:anion-transporting  ArsA/GET3 family ATPase
VPAATALDALLGRRLIVITGKGGVGRTTVAAALGLAAARRGLRTVVAEVAEQDRIARTFGVAAKPFEEVKIAERLWSISVDPSHALREYLEVQVKPRPIADVLAGSKTFAYFAAATPGMAELLTMGKLWELARLERKTRGASAYDVVIVDAPATGHGVALLRAPKTFSEIARVGPIASQGDAIHQSIVDERFTAVVAVAGPEEMPVNETIALRTRLREELEIELRAVIVNGCYPRRFGPRHAARLRAALAEAGDDEHRAALRAALSSRARAERQAGEVERLGAAVGAAPAVLPQLFAKSIGPPELERLSRELERVL